MAGEMKTEYVPIDSDKVPEPDYNQYGQIQCHRCGCYSDIIYPAHLRNENGFWVSLLCMECVNAMPRGRMRIDHIGDNLKAKGPPYP